MSTIKLTAREVDMAGRFGISLPVYAASKMNYNSTPLRPGEWKEVESIYPQLSKRELVCKNCGGPHGFRCSCRYCGS